jgi:hypothetical protein
MTHIVYVAPQIVCPWPGCGFRIELLDLKLEISPDTDLYARVMASWGHDPNFGVVGRCPACRNFVLFGLSAKIPIPDPSAINLPMLPDDWHLSAYIG